MTEERKAYIEAVMEMADDMPDGAFFAFLEEQGIDVEELEQL